MAKFLRKLELNLELKDLFEHAEKQLFIVSPFIKLHPTIKEVLYPKKEDHKLEIVLVFGKNENKIEKSLGREEFEFFKDFPNIKIKHEPNLHAKYYANEFEAILSSMNLYDYSMNNNVEFGILTSKQSIVEANLLGNSIDTDAFLYFSAIIENCPTYFRRVPKYEEKLMGLNKVYTHSETVLDKLSSKYNIDSNPRIQQTPLKDRKENIGFCIRTRQKIPFNPQRPFSDAAYKSWNRYKDENYKEKYCHFSGENSNGQTSFAKPILKKNWKNAQAFLT